MNAQYKEAVFSSVHGWVCVRGGDGVPYFLGVSRTPHRDHAHADTEVILTLPAMRRLRDRLTDILNTAGPPVDL